MATRRYRKSKKNLKKRGSRRKKNIRSSRRMRGGLTCVSNIEKRFCEYSFENNKVYIDKQNNEYTFDKLETEPQLNNASGVCGKYFFNKKMDENKKLKYGIKDNDARDEIIMNSCNTADQIILNSLILKKEESI